MKLIFLFFSIACFISCGENTIDSEALKNKYFKLERKVDTISIFIDSVNSANPGQYKICLLSLLIEDSMPVAKTIFYKRENDNWVIRNVFETEQWVSDIIEPEISDFNGDSLNDFLYLKGFGARGGNVIQHLFIYDIKGDSMLYISNCNEYPNLYFNKETKSINSYILSGGNQTIFMRLDYNILVPFASIYQGGDYVSVSQYSKDGSSKIIFTDSTSHFDEFAHFTNYNPLTVEK